MVHLYLSARKFETKHFTEFTKFISYTIAPHQNKYSDWEWQNDNQRLAQNRGIEIFQKVYISPGKHSIPSKIKIKIADKTSVAAL